MSAGDATRPAGLTAKPRKPRAKAEALSPDEVRLLRAFRTMDDRARDQQLRICIRFAKEWPRSEPIEPVISTDETQLLADYRSTNHDRQYDLLALSSYYARKYPGTDGASLSRAPAPVLRLVRGGAA
jgi:hypothetical protein